MEKVKDRQPQEPTAEQKSILRSHKMIPDNWLVVSEDKHYLTVRYKHGKTEKKLKKGINLWKGV